MPGNWEFRTEWRREKLSFGWSLGKRGATGWSRAQDELEGESYPRVAGPVIRQASPGAIRGECGDKRDLVIQY